MTLATTAEKKAEEATKLKAFPVNLSEVRRSVKEILSTFGSNGIFREYTTHDITHVDDMLATVDWIIPEKTKSIMSKGDWLTLVLSIYFHDMGLVVTEEEFKRRGETGFEKFCNEKLFSGPGGADYKAKLDHLESDPRDRFLYQEFVRYHHATRIRSWITGAACLELGHCVAQIELVTKLLGDLGSDYRKHLALVCESHNLDDIEDTKKYPQSHPYGNSDEEEVNLQYIAALLRTIDLVQITSRRAPSTLYRLIDPADPISQQEWAKQNAVTRVRAQKKYDDDGAVIPGAQSDTIEVFAQFEEEHSFFGLNAYIRYANDQIRETYQILERSRKTIDKDYIFPWRGVDDSAVVASGFVDEPFGFEIDQGKILDLLTGHTLYNDSAVVLRELAQNSVDAVRLQFFGVRDGSEKNGRIKIEWDSATNELKITDNGTGMSQDVIENHLLKVGSSRYQDPRFKEKNPDFTPISRFGIGVLSAFMVADKVEITTVSPENVEARRISLRSVHGKYLIKLIDKKEDAVCRNIGSHGTQFVLRFRASAKQLDLERTLQSYILFPRCDVRLTIDGGEEIRIGYSSPKNALEEYIAKENVVTRFREEKIEVKEVELGGIKLAYAMSFSSHFKDWQFVRVPERSGLRSNEVRVAPTMTCVEGIAVQDTVIGGFDGSLLAVLNMTGKAAPKTNVARSALESTKELDSAISVANRLLLDAVEDERSRLVREEEYSLTWAVDQMPYLMSPVVSTRSGRYGSKVQEIKSNELYKTKMFLSECGGKRSAISAAELLDKGEFWTVDSILLSSCEQFIRESKTEIAASGLLKLINDGEEDSINDILVVPNIASASIRSSVIHELFEVGHIRGVEKERRLDAKWEKKEDRWVSQTQIFISLSGADDFQNYELYRHMFEARERSVGRGTFRDIFFPRLPNQITTVGLERVGAVVVLRNLYVLPDVGLPALMGDAHEGWESDVAFLRRMFFNTLVAGALASGQLKTVGDGVSYLRKLIPEPLIDRCARSLEECQADWSSVSKLETYDPFAWQQRSVEF